MFLLQMADKMITLVASDGNKFEVKANFKNLSEMVRDWINTFGENTPVPVNRISGATILKMIEWTEHYNYEPPNLDNVDKELWPNNIPVWDKKFLDDVSTRSFVLVFFILGKLGFYIPLIIF